MSDSLMVLAKKGKNKGASNTTKEGNAKQTNSCRPEENGFLQAPNHLVDQVIDLENSL